MNLYSAPFGQNVVKNSNKKSERQDAKNAKVKQEEKNEARVFRMLGVSALAFLASWRSTILLSGLSLAILALVSVAFGAASDTRPVAVSTAPKPMSEPYRILLTRSVFARDHRGVPLVSPVVVRPPETREAPRDPGPPPSDPETAEANFVLTGVAIEDETGWYTAFFEQTATQRLLRVHLGEFISHGQVIGISLDGVDYAGRGRPIHVTIGQALSGGMVVASTQPTSSPAGGTPSATGGAAADKPSWWRKKK